MCAGVDCDPLGQHGAIRAVNRTIPAVTAGVAVSRASIRLTRQLHCQVAIRTSDSLTRSQTNVEVPLGESFGQSLTPLHHDDRVVKFGVEIQRVELAQQVGVAALVAGSNSR